MKMIIGYLLTIGCIFLNYNCLAEEFRKVKNPSVKEVIYNGSEAAEGQFPFAVRTLIPFDRNKKLHILCGATLIAPQWAVTAAHCAFGADEVIATLGMVNSNDFKNTLSFAVPKENIFVHPKFSNQIFSTPDVALYKLPEEIPFSKYPHIKPVQLSNSTNVSEYDGKLVTTIGWGVTEFGKDSDTLKFVTVKVMPNDVCQKKFSAKATSKSVCTERIYKEAGPCYGDSGGPLIFTPESGDQTLIGLTSFGVGFPDPCSDPNGGVVYTFVPSYSDWMKEIMGSK